MGVSVPHVYETGLIDGCSYTLMSYVPARTLEHVSETELKERGAFKQMGGILRKMHSIKAKGFGTLNEEGMAKYESFEDWIFTNPQTQNQLEYMAKHDILPVGDFGSVDEAIKILADHIKDDLQTVYCHWDFAPGNILDTEPLTVFDPIPTFNNPYLDIARSMMQTVAQGFTGDEVCQQFFSGYFSDRQPNEKLLYAALLFICHTKMPYWHRTNQENIIRNLHSYLNKYKVSFD